MSPRTVLGTLSQEDLGSYRALMSRQSAMHRHPEGFSAQEHEQSEMVYFRQVSGIVERFEVNVLEPWYIDIYRGQIVQGRGWSEERD